MFLVFGFVIATQVGPPRINSVPDLKSTVGKIRSLASEKPTAVGRLGPWHAPGYYEQGTQYRVNMFKADEIRKKLVAEGFSVDKRYGSPPTQFSRKTGDVAQQVQVDRVGERGSEYVLVRITESPVLPKGLKVWPKPLVAPTPPISRDQLYPLPVLKSFQVETVSGGAYKGTTAAVVHMSSKGALDQVIQKLDKSLTSEWVKSPSAKLTRYSLKKSLGSGPYQIDVSNARGVTAIVVTSRIVKE